MQSAALFTRQSLGNHASGKQKSLLDGCRVLRQVVANAMPACHGRHEFMDSRRTSQFYVEPVFYPPAGAAF